MSGQSFEEIEGIEKQPAGAQGVGPRATQAVGDATIREQGKIYAHQE